MVWAPRPGALDVLGITSPVVVGLQGSEVCGVKGIRWWDWGPCNSGKAIYQ